MVKVNHLDRRGSLFFAVQRQLFQHSGNTRLHIWFQGFVHQALRGRPNQMPAFFENVQCDTNRHHGIQPQPTAVTHQRNAQDHASRSPHIGHQVTRIRF